MAVWRYGSATKSNGEDGPYALFQNTFLVRDQDGQASFMHFRNTARRVMPGVSSTTSSCRSPHRPDDRRGDHLGPVAAFPAATDGNAYYRMGAHVRLRIATCPTRRLKPRGPADRSTA